LTNSFLNNLSLWINESNVRGNIFITDQEADVNWLSLQAIGRNKTNQTTSNDFSDIDSLLNMGDYQDSVYLTFTNSGVPKSTDNFFFHNRAIENVPVVNSTNNSNFVTGILWDMSDDVGDNEYSQDDKEDLIFVAKLNNTQSGAYGVYDYEVKVPVRLREYDSSDKTNLYFYYDLI
jgi:hypothetical protein